MLLKRLIATALLLLPLWVAAQSPCPTLALPMGDDLDSYTTGTLPPCWWGTRNYDLGPAPQIDNSRAHSGSRSLRLHSGSISGSHYSLVVMPELDATELDGLYLRLHMLATSTTSRLEVGICQDTTRYTHRFHPIDTLHVDHPSQWQERVVDLGRYSGEGRRLAFRMQRTLQGGTADCWIDNLRIGSCGTTQPAVSHITHRSLTLDWQRYGTGNIHVQYAGITMADAASPLTIQGLDPNTTYTFTVGCAGSPSQQVTATTLAGPTMQPAWYEPFGNSYLTLPPSDTSAYLLPLQEDVPVGELHLAMLLRGAPGTRLVVGVMDYPLELASFTPLDTLTPSTTWQRHLVSLAPYSGNGQYIALKALGDNLHIDNLRLARCMIDSVRLYNLTQSEVTLDWSPLTDPAAAIGTSGGGAIILEYGPRGFTPGSGTTVIATSKPYTLGGLAPASQYDLYIYPACGDHPCAYDLHRFNTFAHAVTLPYCTSFNASGLPQGWVCPQGSASANTTAYEGSHSLLLSAGTTVTLPLTNIASDDSCLIDFYSYGSGTLTVGTMDYPYGDFTPEAIFSASAWQHHVIRLNLPAGHVPAIRSSGQWRIDAVTLHRDAVEYTSVSQVDQTSALIEWGTYHGDSVRVEYRSVASANSDFADGTGTRVTALDSLRLTGLTPGTHYAIHITPLCDTGATPCYRNIVRLLTAPVPQATPVCENFDALPNNGYPSTWRRTSPLGDYPIVSTQRNRTPPHSLYLRAPARGRTFMQLPDLVSSSQHLVLAFWSNATAMPAGSMLVVGRLSDIGDPASFIPTDTVSIGTLNTWHHHVIDLGTLHSGVALMLLGGSSEARLFIDDLCLQPCSIHNIHITRLDSTSVTIAWENIGSAAAEITLTGDGSTRTLTFNSSPATITGLTPDALYTVTLRSVCECGGYGYAHHIGYGSMGQADDNKYYTFTINLPPPFFSIPYCAPFETYFPGQFPYHWRRIGGSASISDVQAHDSYRSLKISNNTTLLLPPTEDPTGLVLSLQAYTTGPAALTNGAWVVGVMRSPDSISTFIPLDTLRMLRIRDWQRFTVNLASPHNSHSYIALRLAATDTCTLFIDDISVNTCGLANATVSSGGVVDWVPQNSPTKVAIEYGPRGFLRGSGTSDTVSAPPYSLSGLSPGVNFDIYLTALCDTIADCSPVKITLNSPTATPFCEFFELSTSNGLPDGWTIGRNYTNTPALSTSGNRHLILKGHSATTNRSIAVLPPFSSSADSIQLGMSMLTSNMGNARLAIGYIDAHADPNTFTPLDTLLCHANNSWQRCYSQIPLADGRRIALCCYSIGPAVEVRIDSLSVTSAITPSVTVTSARSLELTLHSMDCTIEYGPAGTVPGTGTTLHITSPHHTLTGLQPGQTYWLYTLENGSAPTCLPPLKVPMPQEESLPYCQSNLTFSQLQLPEMDIDSVRRLHLYLTLQGCTVVVGMMNHANDWDHFLPIDTLGCPAGTRHRLHTSLQNYRGEARFIGLRSMAGNAIVEELSVTACPWVEVSPRISNHVALLGSGTIEYGPAGFTLGSGTAITVIDSMILAGLADNTDYDFYPLCDHTSTACYSPWRHSTTYTASIPYCTDFTAGIPLGWIPFSDAIGNAVSTAGGELSMAAAGSQQVGIQLPMLPAGDKVIVLEAHFSSASLALLVDRDTLRMPAGSWQQLRIRTHSTRPRLQVVGNGTIKLRRIDINTCALPHDIMVGKPGGGRIVLSWDTTGIDMPFFFEYRLAGNPASATTVRATTPPMALSLLPDTLYHFHIKCDSLAYTCQPAIEIATLPPPLSLPYCIDTVMLNPDRLPEGWSRLNSASGTTYLVLPQLDADSLRRMNIMLRLLAQSPSQRITLGAMTDAADATTFDSLTTLASSASAYRFYTLDSYLGAGRFLALRIEGTGWVRLLNLSVTTCAAYHVQLTETEADRALFTWESQGQPTVSIEYGPTGFAAGSGTVISATTPPLMINGLDALTDYTFYVTRQCSNVTCRPALVDTFFTFTPKGGTGCIDYTDLRASYVTCKYGSYSSPSNHLGVVDHGYLSAASRHTVHFDTTERDARTGGLLRTVPAGGEASVRLGNWTTGGSGAPEAESITYGMTVDSTSFDLLILKYAAVLQDPEHSVTLQPRFRLEILNQNEELIDSCGMAFFIANPNLHWNRAANEVLWKDWTTVGMDLGAYHGQTIFIRLTTNDCGEGSHFGYAYFTLECASKRMQTEGCSNVPSNRFTAPSGFNYRWYTNLDTTTISDSSSIWVRSDNSKTYYCNLSFIDNPSCNFTMSAFAGARYPLSLFDTSVAVVGCQFDLTLTNRSTISGDGVTPIGTGESCESTRWILHDGTYSSAHTLTLHLTDTGTYNITLISGIANDQCIDTLHMPIHISYPHPAASLAGRDRRCDNDLSDTLQVLNAASWRWDNGAAGLLVTAPLTDTSFRCFTVDHNGCHDTLTHPIRVFPSYQFNDRDSLCNTATSYRWLDTTVDINQTAGILARTRHLTTAEGCDSVRNLSLQLMPSYYIHHHDTLCHDTQQPFFDTLLTSTGDYLHIDSTAFGCDSMVTMHLQIVPRTYADDIREVCDSLTWLDGNTYFSDSIGALDTLFTARGCDSVVTLHLTVHHSTHEMAIDTFCQGSTYLFRNHLLAEGGYYADTLATVHGCDSVLAISLTRLDLPLLSISSDYDCDTLYHHIHATCTVPYLLWSAYPPDSTLDGQEHLSTLHVRPQASTTYTLYADYAADPHCPATASITLAPASRPEAVLKVNPNVLVLPNLEFDAFDLSREYEIRQWYINGLPQGETSRHLQGYGLSDNDTTRVALIVDDGHCTDTAIALLPHLHSSLIAPNAFTPDQETNNTFYFTGRGVLSAEIHIYNRQGTLVFHSKDFHARWDGRNRSGQPCPSGSYVWHIRYSAETHPQAYETATGSVLLLH